MTSLLIGSIFAILRAADGENAVTRGVVVACAALLLTIYSTSVWWMTFVQAVAVYSIFWGGWSSMLDWAQGLPLSDPKEHRIASYIYKIIKSDRSWTISRMCVGITPVCIINGVWYAIPVGVLMAFCYEWSFFYIPKKLRFIKSNSTGLIVDNWSRWAEYASWYLLGICLV